LIAAETVVVYLLTVIAPVNACGMVYMLGVLLVSIVWGFGLAVMTSLASALAFVYFHMGSGGRLIPTEAPDVVALAVFLIVALLGNTLAGLARTRAAEADQRRREADFSAELARLMLRSGDLHDALDRTAQRLAQILGLSFAALTLEAVPTEGHDCTISVHDGGTPLATLLVPCDLPIPMMNRLRNHVVPALAALLTAARERDKISLALQASRKEQLQFFELSSDLLCIARPPYLTRVNPAFERALGYPSDELLSRPFRDFVHPDDRRLSNELFDDIEDDHGTAQFEHRCIRSDGSVLWLEWTVVSDQGLHYGAARDVTQRRHEQDELRQAQRMIEASHHKASVLAKQQSALRRVATLVARGVSPSRIFPATVEELGRGLGAGNAGVFRYDPEGIAVMVAVRDQVGMLEAPGDESFSLEGDSVVARVARTGRAARIGSYTHAEGSTAARMREKGMHSAVGAPIVVDDDVWGAVVMASSELEGLPPDAEARLGDFADLVATAISNAQTRAELAASRARIVTAADDARRRIERDLHDGAQQRLVSLALELRIVEDSVPPDLHRLRDQLAALAAGLAGVSSDLREISRGIHPGILSRGGLGPALKTLAGRAPLPVQLDIGVDQRLSAPVEMAAYYVVAEALTNVAKHAQASEVNVCVEASDTDLHLSIRDNGIGGADRGRGSGLVGLTDRVEALGGHLDIRSPSGQGTTLHVTIPHEPRTE
jgi:PAS domain S-box-containing protein